MALLAILALATDFAFADPVSGALDAGGGVVTGNAYRIAGSVGAITADESSAGPYRGQANIPGIAPGVKRVAIHASPMIINEGTTSQLSATAILEDDSTISLNGAELLWESPAYPIQTVSGSGLLSAVGDVYSIATGLVRGRYQYQTGQLMVEVRGPYAGSGIPDDWFVRYFGPAPNPEAAPGADPTGCGQTNQFKYVAGLDPTSATSVFRLRIEPVAGDPQKKRLVFAPCFPDRAYRVQFSTNPSTGTGWTVLPNGTTTDNGEERAVTDPEATYPTRFYRVSITYP